MKCCLKCVSSLSGLQSLDGTGLKVVSERWMLAKTFSIWRLTAFTLLRCRRRCCEVAVHMLECLFVPAGSQLDRRCPRVTDLFVISQSLMIRPWGLSLVLRVFWECFGCGLLKAFG